MIKLLRQYCEYWKETYRADIKLFVAELLGTILGIMGAFIPVLFVHEPNMLLLLSLWGLSAAFFIYVFSVRHAPGALLLMIVYFILDCIGIYRILMGV